MDEDRQKIANDLHDTTILIEGLAKTLCAQSLETISQGKFNDAINLGFAYQCLAKLANELAEQIHEVDE